MNSVKTLALVASTIGFTNIGLSLPVYSQEIASNQANQTAIVIGNNNTVNQTNVLVINNRRRFNGNSPFSSTTSTTQAAEIQGNSNLINQASDARIDNSSDPQSNDAYSEDCRRRQQGSERHSGNGRRRRW